MRVRPGVESDVPQLLHLIRGLTAITRHNGLSQMTAALLRAQAFQRTPRALSFIVAEDADGTLFGFVSYWVIGDTKRSMHVLAMYVAEHARRQRVGEALARSVAVRALELQCNAISWRLADSTADARFFSAHVGASLDTEGRQYLLEPQQIEILASTPSTACSTDA